MDLIRKTKETMSAKERVQKTFAWEKTDRVTIGYETNAAVHQRLARTLGIADADHELVLQALGVDFRGIYAPYTGPPLYSAPPGRRVDPLEGCLMRWVEHESGGYWDFCDFPLKDAAEEDFLNFPVPDPDHFDYDQALAGCLHYDNQYGLYVGGPGIPDVINSNGRIMGMEDILCHLLTGEEMAMEFINRRVAYQLGMLERTLARCGNQIDFMWLGEDLGTQRGPMISLDLYRQVLKPIHKLFCDLADSYKIPVLVHSCGSSSWAYADFLEIGVRGVDTLQPEAADMSPAYLAREFGGRLSFRGCISTAGPLVTGTPADVEQVCRETLAIMMPHRGYHFAPTHQIQDNTPVENILAMYNAAHRHGQY